MWNIFFSRRRIWVLLELIFADSKTLLKLTWRNKKSNKSVSTRWILFNVNLRRQYEMSFAEMRTSLLVKHL